MLFFGKKKYFQKTKRVPAPIKVSFVFHHIFAAYIIFQLDDDAYPGDFASITLSSQLVKRSSHSSCFVYDNFINTIASYHSDMSSRHYFPNGGKKGAYFIVNPAEFISPSVWM